MSLKIDFQVFFSSFLLSIRKVWLENIEKKNKKKLNRSKWYRFVRLDKIDQRFFEQFQAVNKFALFHMKRKTFKLFQRKVSIDCESLDTLKKPKHLKMSHDQQRFQVSWNNRIDRAVRFTGLPRCWWRSRSASDRRIERGSPERLKRTGSRTARRAWLWTRSTRKTPIKTTTIASMAQPDHFILFELFEMYLKKQKKRNSKTLNVNLILKEANVIHTIKGYDEIKSSNSNGTFDVEVGRFLCF